MTNDDILGVERNFAALSTRDLLEARDQYHWHLIHKPNVVGTAIGLYRIRKSDPWPNEKRSDSDQARARAAEPKEERTFETLKCATTPGPVCWSSLRSGSTTRTLEGSRSILTR
jgi:hypothetical protein